MAELRLKNVTKRFGAYVGVDNFNLDIADQEFLVLLGPSGCGKTTTMRMIAGLEDVTEGEIWLGDRMVNDLEPKDRDISMVFQSYGLYPNMTVYENIRFPLRVRKVPADQHRERVLKAARMVELTDFLDRRPAALSGGQRQRVALGRAIVREPNVFLMDEPLSNLDAKLRVSTRAQIKHLQHDLKIDDDLRHPRPDRGDDARRPGGGDEQGRHPAGRHADRHLRRARPTPSSRASSARRR